MDLVDGHANVFVVLVAVAGGDVLLFGETKDVDEMFHHVAKLLPVEASVLWVKRDDEVMRSVLARPDVLRLDALEQSAGELDAVGAEEPDCSRVGATATNVASQLTKALARRGTALVPDNHRSPANRSTARLTTRAASRSSKLSLWWLAPSEYLGARTTRLAGECFEPDEIVLIEAKGNHSGFLFPLAARFERGAVS